MVVDPSGRAVGWVVLARDVSSVEKDAFLFRESVNVSENVVCRFVSAPALPPALDDPSVISEDLDVGASGNGWGEGEDEE